jgi:hypothetical protein
VCLLEPENPHPLMKSLGDAGVQRFVLQVSKALTPALRQNDISVRYSPLSIVVVFPDTTLARKQDWQWRKCAARWRSCA